MPGLGRGETQKHDSCYFLEATVGHNPGSCLAPHSTSQPLRGSGPLQGTPSPVSAPPAARVPAPLPPLHWCWRGGGGGRKKVPDAPSGPGLGRMVVSAGLNRRGRQPQLPLLPAACPPGCSPSLTRTKFPTCLSVSDSSRKYLAARAPAVLSPLRLLPCLPRGALQTQPGTGGGPEPRRLVGSGGVGAGSEGRRNQSQCQSVSLAWGTEGAGRPTREATRAGPGGVAAADAPAAPRNLPGGPSGGLPLASADETASATPAAAAAQDGAEGTARPLGRALKSGLWPGPERGGASRPSCRVRGTPTGLPPGLGTWPLGPAGGPRLPPAPRFPARLASLPGDQWRKRFLRTAGIFRWTRPRWPAPYLPPPPSFLLPESPLGPNHTPRPEAKHPLPSPLASAPPVPGTHPSTEQTMNG